MKLILAYCSIVLSMSVYSQTELDEVFDDPGSDFSLKIGSNLGMLITGTPNVSLAAVVKDDWWVSGELGLSPFPFRSASVGLFIENGNKLGTAVGLQGARRIPVDYFASATYMTFGFDFQRLNYRSVNDNQLLLAIHDIYAGGGGNPDWYYYQKSSDGEFHYRRKTTGFGFLIGASMEFENNLTFNYLITAGVKSSNIRFLEDRSIDISWNSAQPEEAISGGRSFFGRVTFSLYYAINSHK